MLVPAFKLVLHTVAISIKTIVTSWNQLLYAFIEDGHYEDFQQALQALPSLGHSSDSGRSPSPTKYCVIQNLCITSSSPKFCFYVFSDHP